MIVAIYARKSTDERDKAEDARSCERQIDRARSYAASKGWTVAAEHVYRDDAISGAEFDQRPGLTRLTKTITENGQPPFGVLIISEQSRLGRATIRTLGVLQQFMEA